MLRVIMQKDRNRPVCLSLIRFFLSLSGNGLASSGQLYDIFETKEPHRADIGIMGGVYQGLGERETKPHESRQR